MSDYGTRIGHCALCGGQHCFEVIAEDAAQPPTTPRGDGCWHGDKGHPCTLNEVERLRASLTTAEKVANEPCANCGFPVSDQIGAPKLIERLTTAEKERDEKWRAAARRYIGDSGVYSCDECSRLPWDEDVRACDRCAPLRALLAGAIEDAPTAPKASEIASDSSALEKAEKALEEWRIGFCVATGSTGASEMKPADQHAVVAELMQRAARAAESRTGAALEKALGALRERDAEWKKALELSHYDYIDGPHIDHTYPDGHHVKCDECAPLRVLLSGGAHVDGPKAVDRTEKEGEP